MQHNKNKIINKYNLTKVVHAHIIIDSCHKASWTEYQEKTLSNQKITNYKLMLLYGEIILQIISNSYWNEDIMA